AKRFSVSEKKMRAFRQIEQADGRLAAQVESGSISIRDALRELKATTEQAAIAQFRRQLATAGSRLRATYIRCGDFNQLLPSLGDNSVDLIFTDPIYGNAWIPIYGQLAQHAERVLKPGGSLVCYCGQNQLPSALQLLGEYLRYWWTLCVHY